MPDDASKAMAMPVFYEEDVRLSHTWLNHSRFTQLVSLHPEFRSGSENYEHNKTYDTFPRIWYARNIEEVVGFVKKNTPERMVCYGLNERARIFKNDRGFARAAREDEIETAQTILIDVDVVSKNLSAAGYDAFQGQFDKCDDYFRDQGFLPPVRAHSGTGFHLLIPYSYVVVSEYPDIAARQRKFVSEFGESFRAEFANLDARIDATQDLSRMVKVYGTAKPEYGVQSRFYGGERVEDAELRTYLISMSVEPTAEQLAKSPAFGPALIRVGDSLPAIVLTLLRTDTRLKDLYEGRGKPEGSDLSGSGFDISVARRLLACGVSDVSDIATVLALRPNGSYANGGKNEQYLRRTIAKALLS